MVRLINPEILIASGGTLKFLADLQIEVSPSPTGYEPYHEPQSFSIQTPTGLPAIPVDTGGNYTDADGQQWIADYVDLKRGKYVQNIRILELTGQEPYIVAGTTIVENDADCYMEVSAGGGDTLRAKKMALILGD